MSEGFPDRLFSKHHCTLQSCAGDLTGGAPHELGSAIAGKIDILSPELCQEFGFALCFVTLRKLDGDSAGPGLDQLRGLGSTR